MTKADGTGDRLYQTLAQLLPRGCTLLDLACGDGTFLRTALQHGAKRAVGVEITEEGVLGCVASGLSVHQGDITEGLADYPENCFDYVSLIRTVELLPRPEPVLAEMLRVGRMALLTFTNFGQWRYRLSFFLTGISPGTLQSRLGSAPTKLTLPLLRRHCRSTGIRLRHFVPSPGNPLAGFLPSLFARELAVVLVSDPKRVDRGSGNGGLGKM